METKRPPPAPSSSSSPLSSLSSLPPHVSHRTSLGTEVRPRADTASHVQCVIKGRAGGPGQKGRVISAGTAFFQKGGGGCMFAKEHQPVWTWIHYPLWSHCGPIIPPARDLRAHCVRLCECTRACGLGTGRRVRPMWMEGVCRHPSNERLRLVSGARMGITTHPVPLDDLPRRRRLRGLDLRGVLHALQGASPCSPCRHRAPGSTGNLLII